jgi:PAS domain S-box-containing protein
VFLAVTSDVILLSSYKELEKKHITSEAQHVSNQIDDKLTLLDSTVQDLALELSSGPLQKSKALLSEHHMRSHSLDLAAVYDAGGHLVTIAGYDCEENESAFVPANQQKALGKIVSQLDPNELGSRLGVVNLDGSPLMVAIRHVRGSSKANWGTVVAGWFVDRVEIERIFRASGSTINIYDLESTLLPDLKTAAAAMIGGKSTVYAAAVTDSSVGGYFTVKDMEGKPSFIVRIVEKRVLYDQGKTATSYVLFVLLIVCIVLCSVMLVFIRTTILSRLHSLISKVQNITQVRDVSARLTISDHCDELSLLALSINQMLESLENAETAMRESEERYRMLFDRAPDAIIIIGIEGEESGVVIAANQAAADQHGYTLDELRGMRIQDLNTAETNKISGEVMATIAAGEWLTTELWHQKKDGTRFPIEIHAGPIMINGKQYILGFDRDISQRKLTEEMDQIHLGQIRQLNDELSRKALKLAAANNELETFNYSVSHDMRGPLTRISGYCQLLLDDDTQLDPRVKEYVERIYESETWLNDMIDALLHLAQLTRVDIVPVSVNLSEIAESVLKELALESPERTVKTVIGPDIIAAGDSRLLKMVMINLLANSWKYSAHSDEAKIEFGVAPSETGPVYYVRDNGAGFNMKDASKLFRVFTRLHDSSEFEGTGIGLATVQRIILRHGGKIWAEAISGAGATFFFTLP